MATGISASKAVIVAAALISGAILAGDIFGSRYEFGGSRLSGDGGLVWRLDTLTGDVSLCFLAKDGETGCRGVSD